MRARHVLYAVMLASGVVLSAESKAACWNEAGAKYNIDPLLLMAIGWQESRGNPNAVGPPLKDGNVALGLMQINTIHLKNLRSQGIGRQDLFNPCISVHVGASVLRDCINRFGEVWRGVGCYYGGPYSKAYNAMSKYAQDVQKHYSRYVAMYRQSTMQPEVQMPVSSMLSTAPSNQTQHHPVVVGVMPYEPQIVHMSKADDSDIRLIMFDN